MRVENFDQFHQYERRQHEFQGVSLGTRGLPLRGLAYFGALAAGGFVVFGRLGITSTVAGMGGPNAMIALAILHIGLPAALAYLGMQHAPGGLPAHMLILPALQFITTARTLFGWQPISELGTTWSPPELVVEPEISDQLTPHMRIEGPVDLYVGNRYKRVDKPKRRVPIVGEPDAMFFVGSKARAEGARKISIPDGATVEVKGVAR